MSRAEEFVFVDGAGLFRPFVEPKPRSFFWDIVNTTNKPNACGFSKYMKYCWLLQRNDAYSMVLEVFELPLACDDKDRTTIHELLQRMQIAQPTIRLRVNPS